MCDAHSGMKQAMFTFTTTGDGKIERLKIINEIKSYVTYLIYNSKSEIYFFSNIEIGHSLLNPHLHTQIWFEDLNAIKAIYEKVITRFNLNSKNCKLSLPHRAAKSNFYNYLIKDYAKDLSDNDVWLIESEKKLYRKYLGSNVRFISKSKGKYTDKLYKLVYRTYGVLRAVADEFLDFIYDYFLGQKQVFMKVRNRVLFVSMNKIDEIVILYSFEGVVDVLSYAPATSPPYFELLSVT